MRSINLSSGDIAFIDDEDFDLVSKHKWHFHNWGYAQSTFKDQTGKAHCILMHRLILNFPEGQSIDHRNQNKLDNTRANLRIATRTENACNCGRRSHNTTGFKGVSVLASGFRAAIGIGNEVIYLGTFRTAKLAALAYDAACQKLHKDFAVTNRSLGLI